MDETNKETKTARFSTRGTWLAWFTTRGMQVSIAALTTLFYIPYLSAGWFVDGLLYAVTTAILISTFGKLLLSIDALEPGEGHHWLSTPRMKAGYVALWTLVFFSVMWERPTDTPIVTVAAVGLGASISSLGVAALSKWAFVTARRYI